MSKYISLDWLVEHYFAEDVDYYGKYVREDLLSEDTSTIEINEDCSDYYKGYCSRYEDGCFHQCKNAPSVIPQPKEGEWIGTEYDGYADGNPVYYEWICSACKCVVEDEEPTWNFCPNCGAKMKG